MREIVRLLVQQGKRLNEQVLQDMYRDPFWSERFGDRGRRHASEDGNYHVTYLAEALLAEDPQVLARYAAWLQKVLTSRGMCSRHLAENFQRLAEAITSEGWPDGDQAAAYLREAEQALRYPDGPARALQDAAEQIARETDAQLAGCSPGHDEAQRARRRDQVRYHLSYLADAVALGTSAPFMSYVAWEADALVRRRAPQQELQDTLHALRAALAAREPGSFGAAPRYLESIETVLGQGAARQESR